MKLVLLVIILSFSVLSAWVITKRGIISWGANGAGTDNAFATRVVKAGDDLQAAINRAQPGDILEIEAGAVFKGPFILPVKTGNAFITIQSSRLSELPPSGSRVNPSHAHLMAKVVAVSPQPAISTAPKAHHYRFIGIEFLPLDKTRATADLIRLGDGSAEQNSPELVAHDLILDRCYIHGHPGQEVKRGVALNSAETEILNSYISDIHGEGYDTQAICGWNGPGPFHIINNHLEAAGENVMFGGADPAIANLIPSDIEIRGNYFVKPLSWKKDDPSYAGRHWSVKNLFETKNARRVLVDGNLFENCWVDAQVGFAILLKSNNQDNKCPWCVTEDLVFSNNIVRNVEHGLNILGYDIGKTSGQARRIRVVNNLWENINGMWFQGTDGADDILIEHNTHFQGEGNIFTLYGKPTTGFVYRYNVTLRTGYGVKGDGTGEGRKALEAFCPGYVFTKNVIAGVSSADYPPGNFYPTSLQEIGFVDLANHNYRLSSKSRYSKAAPNRKDLGCDFDALGPALQARSGEHLG
jgi:hypothetical protein